MLDEKIPAHLNDDGRAEWRRLSEMLASFGILRPDPALMVAHCSNWQRLLQAERAIAESGPVVRGSTGTAIANPWIAISDRATKNILRILIELGLDKAERNTFYVNASADELEELQRQAEERERAERKGRKRA